jgi:hypothetical protein
VALATADSNLDGLIITAEKLYDEYEEAESYKARYPLRPRVRKLFDELEKHTTESAVEAIAKFYEFPELDYTTTGALVNMDSKAAHKAISKTLRLPEKGGGGGGRSVNVADCRRARILGRCHKLSGKGLSSSTLKDILKDDAHPLGVRAALKLVASRLTPRKVTSVLDVLGKTSGSRGLGVFEPRSREDVVFEFLIEGLRRRGRPPTGPLDGLGREAMDELPLASDDDLEKLDDGDVEEIFAAWLDYAAGKDRSHVVRAVALRALGAHQRESVLQPLREIFETQSEHRTLVLAATKAAISLNDSRVGPWLLPVIENTIKALRKDPSRIEEAVDLVQAIYPLQIKDAAKIVIKLARSKNRYLRTAAVASLPILGEKAARPLLKRHLDDSKNWRMQIGAIEACRRMRSRLSVDLLIERMEKQRGRLQYDILVALHDLTGVGMPYIAPDWESWWKAHRDNYQPPEKQKSLSEKQTVVLFPDAGKLTYFGIKVLSNRLCFIADTSGSMSAKMTYQDSASTRIDAMKSELRRLVKTFDKRTYFNLYFFESGYKKLFKRLTPRNKKSQKAASKFLGGVSARGGTNLYDPLEDALQDPNVDTIYLLSDGRPSAGKYTDVDDILRSVRRLNRLRKIQINTIAIGSDSKLMRRLARQNGGFYRSLK